MTGLEFQSIAQIVAGRGLNTVLEGLALPGLSWGVLRVFGSRSSMTRFAVWFSTLLVIAGLPLLSFSLAANSSSLHESGLTLPGAWASGLFVVWAVIAGALLVRLGFSLWHVHKLRCNCREIDANSHPVLMEVAEGLDNQGSRQVKLLISDQVRVPTALGFFCPAIVLPSWTLRDLSTDELRVIVLHELAHLRRWDDWTNLTQKFVKALFFFHPAVWWIDSRLALEREMACDDMVLEQSANARTYAASLVSIAEKLVAEKMRMGRAIVLAQSALGRVKEVSQRVAQILDTRRERTNRGLRPAFAMVVMLSVITFAAMPYAPELISFQGKAEPVMSAASGSVTSLPIEKAPVAFQEPVSRMESGPLPGASSNIRTNSRADVIPAKATLPRKNHTPKLIMANAPDHSAPADTLLVWHSSHIDEKYSWSLTVWRVRSASGEQQFLQETIVMNSL